MAAHALCSHIASVQPVALIFMSLLADLVLAISSALPQAGPSERPALRQAIAAVETCRQSKHFLTQDAATEVQDQLHWLSLYKSHQGQVARYFCPLRGGLVPQTSDDDELLARFADEVREGAMTVAYCLDVSQPAQWKVVERTKKRQAQSNDQSGKIYDVAHSAEMDENEEVIDDAFQYDGEAYF